MPLIQSLSFTNQNVATGKNVAFSAVARDYEMASFRIFLYELGGAPATLKSAVGTITKSGQVSSRFNIAPSVSTSVTSVALQSDYFVLANGDAVSVFVTSATAGDTTNVDIIAELWGVPDLSALITTVDTVVDAIKAKTDNLTASPADESLLEAYISTEISGLATSAALGMVSSVVNTLPSAAEIDAQLSGTHGAGTWSDAGGSGAIDWSDQFIVTVGGLPRDGVFVRFTTDAGMLNTVATGTTNTFGKLDALMLDPGTYYVWLQLAGVNFAEPAGTEVVA